MPLFSSHSPSQTQQRSKRKNCLSCFSCSFSLLIVVSSLALSACSRPVADSDSDSSEDSPATEQLATGAADQPAQTGDMTDPVADHAAEKVSDNGSANVDWRPLFNGHDLTGWSTSVGMIEAWGIVGEELVTVRPGKGDWLFTDETFTDFELELEFFLPTGANSGVGLRVAEIGDPGYGGYEIQLVDSAGQPPALRNAGAIFDIVPARVMAIHPANQWNTLRIKLSDQTLDVWLNDQLIHDSITLPPLPDRDPFTSGEELTGRIALQDNAGNVRYRNIRIHVLANTSDDIFSLDRLSRP